MVHISKLAKGRVEKCEDVVKIGDELEVKVAEIDSQGRINLIRNDIEYDNTEMPRRSAPGQRRRAAMRTAAKQQTGAQVERLARPFSWLPPKPAWGQRPQTPSSLRAGGKKNIINMMYNLKSVEKNRRNYDRRDKAHVRRICAFKRPAGRRRAH